MSSDVQRRRGSRSGRGGRHHLRWQLGGGLDAWQWPQLGLIVGGWALGIAAGYAVVFVAEGSLGRPLATGIGLGVAALVLLVFALVFFRWRSPRGMFRLRFVDLVVGVLFGLIMPFVGAGWYQVFGASLAWPTYDVISRANLVAGVAVPLVAAALLPVFFAGVVLVVVFAFVRRVLPSRAVAGVLAVAVATAAWTALPLVLDGGVFAPPPAVSVAWGLGATAVAMVTGRLWGAVTLSVVFVVVWIGLSLVGTVLG